MNKVILIGRLIKDPELRVTDGGSKICRFTLAVNRYNSKTSENEADFINCVAFGNIAQTISTYVRKGHQFGLEGNIKVGSYTDKEGNKKYTTDVLVERAELLTNKKDNDSDSNYQKSSNQMGFKEQEKENPFADMANPFDIHNDDLPF